MTAARLAALALLVVVARHVQVTGRILGVAAAVVALALLASMLVRARLSWSPLAQRTGAAVAAAIGGTAGWLEAPALRTAGLARVWCVMSLGALFAATLRLWTRAPEGGYAATFVVGLAALVACGETIFGGGGYGAFVVAYLLLGLLALRAHDPGRAEARALPARAWIAAGALGVVAAASAGALAAALPPLALRVRDRLLASFDPTVGLGDRMVLGSLEGMLVSDEIVARVYGPKVDYLRGVVYDHYQAGQWAASSTDGTRTVRLPPGKGGGDGAGPAGGERVRVVLVASKRGDRYPVPLGARAIATPDGAVVVDRFGALRPERGGPTEISFEIADGAQGGDYPPSGPSQDDKRMPVKLSDAMGPLARRWIQGKTSPEERVSAIAEHLRSEYTYSLHYERKRGDPLLDFLHENRQGHCEYFASAMAMLARRAGIPARVVAGYRVAEYNEIGGYSVVRQQNAHAWVEVYIAGKGWQTVDPTPEDLLPQNRASATPFASALVDVVRAWSAGARDWLAERSLEEVIAMLLAIIAAGLAARWWGRRGRARAGAPDVFFRAEPPPAPLARLLDALAHAGHARDPAEPLDRFAERLGGDDPGEASGAARALLLRYAALRYGGVGDAAPLFADMERCAAHLLAGRERRVDGPAPAG